MKSLLVQPGQHPRLVDVTFANIQAHLASYVDLFYPSDDPIAILYDDNRIANGCQPNRTIYGDIMPGDFFITGMTPDGNLCDLEQQYIFKYLCIFWQPEYFGPGEWDVITIEDFRDGMYVIRQQSRWVPRPNHPSSSAPSSTVSSANGSSSHTSTVNEDGTDEDGGCL